jgi:hypothetical protein
MAYGWSKCLLLSPTERPQALEFAEDYKAYLNLARSAITSQREMVRRAKAAATPTTSWICATRCIIRR